jgi:NAD dependent epimerase/dehydratase
VSLTGKRVLVTGGGGFIGSHLVERLVRKGATTCALIHYRSTGSWGWLDNVSVRDNVEVVQGDVRDLDSLRPVFRGVEVVFHLAALIGIPYSYHAPHSYVLTNTEGTLNVLQAARDAGVQMIVHTSTSEVYGTAQRVPIPETHPLQAQSPYAASKIAADKLAEAYYLSFGLPVVVIRPFNTYGPRQSARAVIPTIVTQALNGSEIHLGNLAPTRDFNYVADTVDGFVRIAECDEAIGRVINIGSGRETSINCLVRTILRLLSKDVRIVCDDERVRPDESEVDRLLADNTVARELLGWKPSLPLEEGLQLTIEWMRDNSSVYRSSGYVV